jgi:hypothetical protein
MHGFATTTELVPTARLITQAAANLLGYTIEQQSMMPRLERLDLTGIGSTSARPPAASTS